METNNNKCPYCYSKLKKSELNCPKCREKIFSKETRITTFSRSTYIWWLLAPNCFLVLFLLIVGFWTGYGYYWDFEFFEGILFSFVLLISIGLCILFGEKQVERHFIISSEKIQVKIRHNLRISNRVVVELMWKEINRIEIIKKRYYFEGSDGIDHSINSDDYLKFYLSKREISFIPRSFKLGSFTEEITNLIKEFSEYLKKEIIELKDSQKV